MDESTKSVFGSLKNLFPTKMSFVVFVSYMGLFINQGKLIHFSLIKLNKINSFKRLFYRFISNWI